MGHDVNLDERAHRLTDLTCTTLVLADCGLVKAISISDTHRTRITTALNIFLWCCLTSHFPEGHFALTDDMLRDYEHDIIRLPNITPNGLLLPKAENILAYNLLQKEVSTAFSALGIGDTISRIQFPVNVRLQSGIPDAHIDSRPRASVKPHSDIWAGDPASGILVFLSVLGDPSKAGIDFMLPKAFPVSYVRTLEDYNEGQPLVETARHICSFDARGWYFVDPYLLHRTTKTAPGHRISIDIRFIPAHRVTSDIDEDPSRRPWFTTFTEWQNIGGRTLLMTHERMADYAATTNSTPYTVGYPVELTLMDMEPAYDTALATTSR